MSRSSTTDTTHETRRATMPRHTRSTRSSPTALDIGIPAVVRPTKQRSLQGATAKRGGSKARSRRLDVRELTPPQSPSHDSGPSPSQTPPPPSPPPAAATKSRRSQPRALPRRLVDRVPEEKESRKRPLHDRRAGVSPPRPLRTKSPAVQPPRSKRPRTEPSAAPNAAVGVSYYATPVEDECLRSIGALHGVDPKLLLTLNRGRYNGITVAALLQAGTSIRLPDGVTPCDPEIQSVPSASTSSPARCQSKPVQSRRGRGRTTSVEYDEDASADSTDVMSVEPESAPEPAKPSKPLSVVELAKQSLGRASDPKELVCRDEERARITRFINVHVSSETAGALYVSGKPGAGKTATIGHVIRSLPVAHRPKIVEFNCMSAANPEQVYFQILAAMSDSPRAPRSMSVDEAVRQLETKHLVKPKAKGKAVRMVLLVLDEVDQLETRDKSVLYKVFEWAHCNNSNVVLVGIANGLDLTERVLPMLKSRGISPELMHFLPYKHEQLVEIIRSRLREVPALPDGKPVLDSKAIEICARKVTAFNGDLRNCLDICRCTVEVASKASEPSKGHLGIMMGVFESAFESDKVQKMRNLPTTQKVVLCVLYQSHADGECVAVSHLNTKYLKTCEKRGIQKEKEGFIKILTLMDCSGLIELKGPRGKAELREGKVRLRTVRDDIRFAFKDDSTLKGLVA